MTEEEFKLLHVGDRVRRVRGNIGTQFVLEGRVEGDPNGAPYFRAHFAHNNKPFGRAHLFYAEEIERVAADAFVRPPQTEPEDPPCTATTPTVGEEAPKTASKKKRAPRPPRGTKPANSTSKSRT